MPSTGAGHLPENSAFDACCGRNRRLVCVGRRHHVDATDQPDTADVQRSTLDTGDRAGARELT